MNSIARAKLFEKLWELWPNKEKEHSALKALKVLTSEEDIDPDRLLASANIYALSLNGHCHELGNWLRNDIWKDIYKEFKDVFEYEKRLKKRRDEAKSVITHWKNNRREWWCSIASEEDHIPQVEFAMRNLTFKDGWQKAFKMLFDLFETRFPEGDWRSKTTPSLTWFCKVDYDSSTVLKLLEGEYGKKFTKKKFDINSIFKKREGTMDQDEASKELKNSFPFLKKRTKEKDESARIPKSKFGF